MSRFISNFLAICLSLWNYFSLSLSVSLYCSRIWQLWDYNETTVSWSQAQSKTVTFIVCCVLSVTTRPSSTHHFLPLLYSTRSWKVGWMAEWIFLSHFILCISLFYFIIISIFSLPLAILLPNCFSSSLLLLMFLYCFFSPAMPCLSASFFFSFLSLDSSLALSTSLWPSLSWAVSFLWHILLNSAPPSSHPLFFSLIFLFRLILCVCVCTWNAFVCFCSYVQAEFLCTWLFEQCFIVAERFFCVYLSDLCLYTVVLCAHALLSDKCVCVCVFVYSQVAQSIALESVFVSSQWIISMHARECWDYTPPPFCFIFACLAFLLPLSHFIPLLFSISHFPFSLLLSLSLYYSLSLFFVLFSVTVSSRLLILRIILIFVVHKD